VIVERPLGEVDGNAGGGGGGGGRKKRKEEAKEAMVWVTYHEGLNNAVRKPISLEEFLSGF
jgi:chromosome transmission fidelity protein 18